MAEKHTETLLLCSCENSFSPGHAAGSVLSCTRLCSGESAILTEAARDSDRLLIACRQEESTLRDVLDDAEFSGEARFFDIRNAAGWSSEGAEAGPKIAALIAAARLAPPALPFVTLESEGVTLIYGRDEVAIETGRRLADALDVTVMLKDPREVPPPARREFPIAKGRIRAAKGHLGAFELVVDDFALALPSSRAALAFGPERNGATSRCDLVIDLSGETPLIAADELRDGYLRADPRDPIAVERLIAKARDLVGTFDKPRYIDFKADLCAHSRSKITGCSRCLEVCPTGAITPAGDIVAIDPAICAGCGGCASVCPTGAANYALPSATDIMRRLRVMLGAYREAGGDGAILLFHDAGHGEPLIDALARFGDGLPARVLPFALNEVTQLGIGEIAAAFAYGAAGVAFLGSARPKHDAAPLEKLGTLAKTILPALGYSLESFRHIATDDPDILLGALRAMPSPVSPVEPARFAPVGAKRQATMLALREWQAHAPARPEQIDLPKGAPFGRVAVDTARCTLCLSCVSACPVAALTANPDRPQLRFQEDLCVQCGLCAATCPEKVITLEPRLDFTAINAAPAVLKEEEPHACEQCGKLFGTRSTIEKIKAKLGGSHWMFSGPNADRLRLIGYCDDCRVEAATLQGFDPYAGPERPRVRTTEDYFRTRPEDAESNG